MNKCLICGETEHLTEDRPGIFTCNDIDSCFRRNVNQIKATNLQKSIWDNDTKFQRQLSKELET
jgi:hypothetical protein